MKGRVCLKNAIYFGVMSVLIIRFIHPFISLRSVIISSNKFNFISNFLSVIIVTIKSSIVQSVVIIAI
ncbi:putative ABC transporter permease, partial [Clostridioides difficile]|uniref:putative ABC transporter permease n=1 Tax=Clostridioides difficile TaxID=1496 RepID=UPI003F8D4BD2